MGLNLILSVVFLICSNSVFAQNKAKDVDNFLSELDGNEVPIQNEHHVHNHHAMNHEGHMMKMWFHGGYDEVILFDFWRTDSLMGLILSCAAIFIMGATYEGVKWFRVFLQMSQSQFQILHNKSCVEIALQTPRNMTENSDVNHQGLSRNASSKLMVSQQNEPFIAAIPTKSASSPLSPQRLIQGILYIVQLVLAYWLMLIVMTYNTYLTAAVVLGAGFGHWLFAVLQLRNNDAEATDSFQTDACH